MCLLFHFDNFRLSIQYKDKNIKSVTRIVVINFYIYFNLYKQQRSNYPFIKGIKYELCKINYENRFLSIK